MIDLAITMFTLLTVVSIIDLKTKKIPAFFLTAMLFIVAMVNMLFFDAGIFHLSMGVLAFLFAFLLYDMGFYKGVADIKITILIGMMVTSFGYLILMMVLIASVGTVYKILWRLKKVDEEAFIPALWIVYIALWFNGSLI